ncbi:uncharacterized protein LOC126743031 isoform X2 [Anthonomus grandis grandis]|uniref:uncharacterized protein LOC126743031 isoform X2 n=1 Tax=Anthonomus grandis grandis TaxID=2921223 RepID=UPI0021664234|nr:uncharacterized protein LOC126743031 isoform X2 [Anthonomus grandis grandis]
MVDLRLVRVAIVICVISVVESVSLTYILKREQKGIQPSCIAEGLKRYSAIGWVYPVPEDGAGIPNTTTKFIPSIQNSYNCDFSKNSKCSAKWVAKDWQIDETSSKTREFIDDSRWEDMPTVMTSGNTFDHSYDLDNSEVASFSVRSAETVDIFLCSGWNPRNYPCHVFRINSRKVNYAAMNSYSDNSYDVMNVVYQAFSNIITIDEWRNFQVEVKENKIKLIDLNTNRILFEGQNKDDIRPKYLVVRSLQPSFWKIIENPFMYTATAQISRMGPQIETSYKDLCVSLFVNTCEACQMTFFYMNGTERKDLKHVEPTNYNWTEIKLKQENIQLGRFNLFIETRFSPSAKEPKTGWWAYDGVRVCNENEVKVTYLKLNQTFAEDDTTVNQISCQLIKEPGYKPASLEYDEIEEFPPVETIANDTSIKLIWKDEDPDHYLTYFVYYQGNDPCSMDIATSPRLRSSGFLTTKYSEIILTNLIPDTLYNITISSVLHENDKFLTVKTLETDEPSIKELPIKMHIIPQANAVNISWDRPKCSSRYGRLIYNIRVSNDKLQFNKQLYQQVKNSYLIEGLRPFTDHNLTVETARNAKNLATGKHTHKLTYQFTTLPGVAGMVKNLELYAIGSNKAYFRYDLPASTQGIPSEIRVTKCPLLSRAKCKTAESSISKCTLWPQKMCLVVDYLIPNQTYTFTMSIKNVNSNVFGNSFEVTGTTEERVPLPPQNVTYKVVDCHESTDYCHLNISWFYPYSPNATINAFNIVLNSTYYNDSYSEEDQTIHEVYKIVDESDYLPRYTYQIKYVPYSKEYNLYVQSANDKYKSDFVTTTVKTADLGDHIDQRPKLLGKGDKAIIFKLPPLDRRLDSYTLTVIVQDSNKSIEVASKMLPEKFTDTICQRYGDTWVSHTLNVKDNKTNTITISSGKHGEQIRPNTKYCINFFIQMRYRGEEHEVTYYEKLITPSSPPPTSDAPKAGNFNHLYMLLLLLLLVPIGFAIYWCIKRRTQRRKLEPPENEYESLPFEDKGNNYVNKTTYDHLIRK